MVFTNFEIWELTINVWKSYHGGTENTEFKSQKSILKIQNSNPKSQIYHGGTENTDYKSQNSNIKSQNSNIKIQISKFKSSIINPQS